MTHDKLTIRKSIEQLKASKSIDKYLEIILEFKENCLDVVPIEYKIKVIEKTLKTMLGEKVLLYKRKHLIQKKIDMLQQRMVTLAKNENK